MKAKIGQMNSSVAHCTVIRYQNKEEHTLVHNKDRRTWYYIVVCAAHHVTIVRAHILCSIQNARTLHFQKLSASCYQI
jgi:hypothetical protein